MATLRETIRGITKQHLIEGGLFFAQCTQAVGWIGGTVPSDVPKGSIIELPTSDVSNGGVVVGAGLAGKRPVYTIRYQGFLTYNGASIFNYAAKSKEMWGVPCPIFVRAIGMEGSIGPVASNMHHSAAIRFPGIRVHAPITPKEWVECWEDFMSHDDPMYCSEHRLTYDLTEFTNHWANHSTRFNDFSNVTILGIGAARLSAKKAANQTYSHYAGISKLKPLILTQESKDMIEQSHTVIVVDSDFTICGVSEHICCELSKQYRHIQFLPLGIDDRTAGFSPLLDNKTPSVEEIVKFVEYFK